MSKNTLKLFFVLVAAFASCRFGLAADDAPLLPRNEATFRAIVNATKESNRDVRMRAANALGAMGRSDAVPALKALLRDQVPAVRAAALRALCALLPAGTSLDIQLEVPVEDKTLRSIALRAAAKFNFNQRDELIKTTLESGNIREKVAAIQALRLGIVADKQTLLNQALQDPHAAVRSAAIRNLDNTEEALALVLEAIGDMSSVESFLTRSTACEALGRMKIASTIPQLDVASRDEHSAVRRAAAQALASFKGSPAATLTVRKQLEDTDYTVRIAACNTLGILADASIAQALSERLTDDRMDVRSAAEEALIKLSPDETYDIVLKYADAGNETNVRQRAWHVLGEYAHPATCDVAFAALKDKDQIVSGYAMRIMRKQNDRRMIPFLTKSVLLLPKVFSGAPGVSITAEERGPVVACDLQMIEGLLAATQFGLSEPIEFSLGAVYRSVTPSPSGPGSLWPTPQLAAEAASFLGNANETLNDADKAEAIDLIKKLYDQNSYIPEVLESCQDAIKKLTGEELSVPPRNPKDFGSFFIEIAG